MKSRSVRVRVNNIQAPVSAHLQCGISIVLSIPQAGFVHAGNEEIQTQYKTIDCRNTQYVHLQYPPVDYNPVAVTDSNEGDKDQGLKVLDHMEDTIY